MDDETAIERCRTGDAEAFRHLVERYQAEAMGHAVAILANREDAADAVQEAFVKAFRALDRFDTGRRFYPWFYTILRHDCLKRVVLRQRMSPAECEEADILAPAADSGKERTALLQSALLALSAEERELITLKHLDGLSYAQLAERLEIPPGTVMSRLYHARCRLRERLNHLLKEEP
jgi:RNA polymerase sigma-70 factor (ECF subfamily)